MCTTGVAAEVEQVNLSGDWTADIYRRWEFPTEVEEWWEKAANLHGDIGVFLSPAWQKVCSLAWQTPLLVVVLKQRGTIRGIFPCHYHQTDFGDPAICSLAVDANHYDFLIPGEPEAVLSLFAELIAKHFPGYHLSLEYVPEKSAALIRTAFNRHSFPVWGYSAPFNPYIDTTGEWEKFLSSLSHHLRKELRRKHKLMEQNCSPSWTVYRDIEENRGILDEAFDVEARSWKGRSGSAVLQKPVLERYMRLAIELAARQQRLYILVLRFAEKMTAFQINFLNAGTLFGSKMSFDEEAGSRYSAGLMGVYELSQECFRDPEIRRLNLGGQYDDWKKRWTKETNAYCWLTIYPQTLKGRWQYIVRHRWKELLGRLGIVRRLAAYIRRRTPRSS